MSRVRLVAPLLAALLVAACGGRDERAADQAAAPPASAEAPGRSPVRVEPAPSAGAPAPGSSGAPTGSPPPSAAAESVTVRPTPPGEGSAEAAVAVVRAYYADIARHDYAAAYRRWGDAGRASRQSFDEFRSGFANTAGVEVVTGPPGRIEGAAGSRYVRVPVEVHARTAAGARQCFRGAYTLRRTVVDGAPPESRHWHLYTADLSAVDPVSCAAPAAAAVPTDVSAVVRTFGGRLADVSLLAPPDALRRAIRESYAPLVTRQLLDAWLADPTAAPGRTVSSPWPDRIEIRRARRLAPDRYAVEGDVAYVTSVEKAKGGAVERKPVVLEVVRTEAGWRIGSYRAGS